MRIIGQILTLVLAIFMILWLIRMIRFHPPMFSRANLSKSFFSMGLLALFLIAFIALVVFFIS